MEISNLSIAKDTLIYFLGSLIINCISFFLMPIYTRYMTPADYGILGILTAFSSFVSIFVCLQLNSAIIRFYIELDEKHRRLYVGTMFIAVYIINFFICAILLLVGYKFHGIFFRSAEVTFYPFYVWQLIIIFLSQAWIFPSAIFKARQKPWHFAGVSLLGSGVGVLLTIYFVIIKEQAVRGVIFASLLSSGIMLLVNLLITLHYASFKPLSINYIKKSLAFSLPLIPGMASYSISSYADRFFLDRFKNITDVGLFSFATGLLSPLQVLLFALDAAIMPRFFTLMKQDIKGNEIKRIITLTIFCLGIILSGAVLFSRDIIKLADVKFLPSYNVIPIISLYWFIRYLQFYPRLTLLWNKKTILLSYCDIVSVITNLIFNLIMVPLYGMKGAAFSTLFSSICVLILALIFVKKYCILTYDSFSIGIIILATIGTVFLSPYFPLSWIPSFISKIIFITILFGTLMHFLKIIPLNELIQLYKIRFRTNN
ncbi:MAG: oligosaccharide flippase family protein [Firmicutes bacterium]|nr:oligosaccharide flippase family protein [Bacillota bacterium]